MRSNFNFLLLVLFISSPVNAGNKVGNGGDGVFCKSEIKTGKLLDFYEEEIDFQTSEKNPQLIAEKQLDRLWAIAPKLSDQYLKRLKKISAEIDYKADVALVDVKDSKHLFKPLSDDCQVLQIVIRKAKVLPNEKPFLFREDLWKRLSPLHQAGLLMHEIVYEHLSKLGEEDSVKARKLNRMLFKKEIKKEEFWKFIGDLEVPIYP